MDHFVHDLRHAWRRLRRTPGFTLVAILTLALGIGANTALFSLVNGLLFKPIPVQHLDRLALVTSIDRSTGRISIELGDDERRAIAASHLQAFDQFVLTDPLLGALTGGGEADVVSGEMVSGNYFQVLGLAPRAGRFLQPMDDTEGTSETPVVISERLWRRRFSADPAAIGQVVKIAGYPLVVVGVAPDAFKGTWLPTMMAADVWLPIRAEVNVVTVQGQANRTSHRTLATLKSGATLSQANAAVEAIGRQLHPDEATKVLTALPGRSGIMLPEFDHYGLLMGSAVLALSGLVFLIACANLTNLLLARGAARAGEMAIRMAIGASRGRIVQLLLTETALITGLAGVAGLAVTFISTWLMSLVQLPALDGITIRFDPSPDLRVFIYALLAASAAVLMIGLVPARRAARTEPLRVLAAGGAGAGATMRNQRLRTRLVATQVAMSVVLLVGAGLYVRSAVKAQHFEPGYDMTHAAMASVDFRMQKLDEPRGRVLLTRMLDAARHMTGVQSAALASAVPAAGPSPAMAILPEGQDRTSRSVYSQTSHVSPGFFETLGIPIHRGRDFTDADGPGAPRVAIINEAVAKRLWPGQDPIGRRLVGVPQGTVIEVIGVSANTATSLQGAGMYVYLAAAQDYSTKMSIIVRTRGNPSAILDPLREALRGADADVALFDVRTVADSVGLLLVPIRLAALVLGALGILGFGIAALGVYGVMAYFVSQRSREFGVHKALGASDGDIHAMVLRQGLGMLLRGALPGLVLALIGAGFLQHVLYGVEPRDPLTFAVVPLVLVAVGVVACYLPARRAARVEPTVALRDL